MTVFGLIIQQTYQPCFMGGGGGQYIRSGFEWNLYTEFHAPWAQVCAHYTKVNLPARDNKCRLMHTIIQITTRYETSCYFVFSAGLFCFI